MNANKKSWCSPKVFYKKLPVFASYTSLTYVFTFELLSPSGDLGISLVWHNLSPPPHRHFSVWVLKSSSKWTKLSMRGPQLFSGWYQMILGVFRCSQLFSDVFGLFSDCFPIVFWRSFPTVEILFKWNLDIYDGSSVVLRMISDGFRCFPTVEILFKLN